MLDNKKLQLIRDKILGVTSANLGDLNSTVYLQQIRDAILGVSPAQVMGNLHEIIYLQQIRNARLGVADGQFGSLPASVYLQQIINAFNGVADTQFGNLSEETYLDALVAVAAPVAKTYILRDDMGDTLAAGSINGTLANPTGGVRSVIDTGNKMSMAGGVLRTTGQTAANNPGVHYSSIARLAGRTLLARYKTDTSATWAFSFDDDIIGTGKKDILYFRIGGLRGAGSFDLVSYALNTDYAIAIVLRATGALYFIKGGLFTNWTFLYADSVFNTNPLFPACTSNGNTAAVIHRISTMRIPQDLIAISTLASDSFNRANGALGNTDGAGVVESGGSGKPWASVGTWGVATNKAACSILSGGLGIATVDVGTPNVVVEAICTRTAGNSGLTLRYTDANNYIIAILDGTNLQVIETVAGVPNTLISAVVTYGATKRMVITLDGVKIRAFYGEAVVGAEVTTALAAGNKHGFYTTNVGATFDNIAVWARGNEGQHSQLDSY